MAIKVWTLSDQFNTAELNANFAEVSTRSSYTPTASNLGTVTTHLAMVKNGIARYSLTANSGTWAAGTTYTLCTLPEAYRPISEVLKPILLGTNNTRTAYLWFKTDGRVQIQPSISMTNTVIFIDETYLL